MSFPTSVPALVLGVLVVCGPAAAEPQPASPVVNAAPAPQPGIPAKGQAEKRVGDPYYLSTCAVCAKQFGLAGSTTVKLYEGREVHFCGDACTAEFEKDAVQGIARLDAMIVKDQLPLYPIDSSIVSGRKLGDKPLDFVWNNRLVRLADEGEKAEFLKKPAEYTKSLDQAVIRAQTPTYGLTKCPVQGDILETDEVETIVIANRMVRLCCKKCVTKIRNRPIKYLAMVDYANREAAKTNVAPKK